MRKTDFLSRISMFVFCMVVVGAIPLQAVALVDQCATVDFSTNTLHIPCFNLEPTSYWIDMGLVGYDPIILEIKDFGDNGSPGSTAECASFNFFTGMLYIPCFILDGASFWIDMALVSDDPIQLHLTNFGEDATRVFAFNDLGMHCYDKDFSVFSILPLYNVLHAQVILRGNQGSMPLILDDSQANVFYSAINDANGSINTTSTDKTNFWDFVLPLFGVSLPVDVGLSGTSMPGSQNTPQEFQFYEPGFKLFTAPGIPITSWDDNHQLNSYPLMRIQATIAGSTMTSPPTSAVVPASEEMHCSSCHAANGRAANTATASKYGITAWSSNPNPELRYRENILILHDASTGTNMLDNRPVLCSSCHYSPALDLQGTGPLGAQIGKSLLSQAMHGRHGRTLGGNIPTPSEPPIIAETTIANCYYCHPGSITQCLRGAMGNAGMICQDCHGGLLAVAGVYPLQGNGTRTPWVNEPKCQSCHTGDALSRLGDDIRLRRTHDPADPSATPFVALNKRFAEEDTKLYRKSLGHGGVACESCHGSPHAEWPNADPLANDNVTAVQLQGHTGPIIECNTCHADGTPLSLDGPHGLHNVNDRNWNEHHENFYEQNPSQCKTCHGVNLEGTVLSRAAVDRHLISDEGGTVFIARGTQIHCAFCHGNPLFGGN